MKVTVRRMRHPAEGDSVVEDIPCKRQRLSTLVRRYAANQDVLVGIDNELVPASKWKIRRVRPGQTIDISPAVGGFWFSLALAWELWLYPALKTAAIASASYAASYLGGKLLTPNIDEPQPTESGQSSAWNPHNTQREGIPRPKFYGQNMLWGNIVGSWTDVHEETQEALYLLIDLGDGPVEGLVSGELYFNGQPSSNFSGITTYERTGTFSQTAIFDKHKLEYRPDGMEMDKNESVTWTTPNDFFDDIEFTLEWPNGNYVYSSRGSVVWYKTRYKVEISVKDSGSWTQLLQDIEDGNDMNPVYRAYSVEAEGYNVVRGTQYTLRFTKLTRDSRTRLMTDMKVRSIREVVDVGFKRPGRALLGIKAVDPKQLLGGRLNIKSVWQGRIVNTYDGADWTLQYSRNRAWVVMDILTQPVISGTGTSGDPWTIESYEGLDVSDIDTAWFYEWAQWCEEQVTDGDGGTEDRMPCDFIADRDSDTWTVATQIASIGRAHLYWKGTTLTGWIDTPTATVSGLVAHKNIMPGSWKNAWVGEEELAGRVTVNFRDSARDYERRSLPYNSENAGNYKRRISVDGHGVTSISLATRVGNFILGRNQRIRNRNEFEMDKQGVRYDLGDVIRLHANKPDWGKAYRVVKATADDTVEVDTVPECEAGDALYLQVFNESSGAVEVDPYTVDSITLTTIKITTTWDVEPVKGWLITTGSVKLRRVINNTWLPDHRFKITCETYDGDIEDTDDDEPGLVTPDYTPARPGPNAILPPVNRDEVVELIRQRLTPVTRPIVTDIPGTGNIEWSGNSVDTIYWEAIDLSEAMHVLWKGEQYDIDGNESAGRGSTTDMFVLFDPNRSSMDGFTTTDDQVEVYAAITSGQWLMAINKDGVAYPATPMQLVHAGVLMAGTITAELGQIANLAVGTLQIQDNAVTVPSNSYTAGVLAVPQNTWTDIQQVTVQSTGDPQLILATFVADNVAAGATDITGIRLDRGVTEIYEDSESKTLASGDSICIAISVEDTTSVGEVRYDLAIKHSSSTDLRAKNRSLVVLNVKK